jgi:hypothetical protein
MILYFNKIIACVLDDFIILLTTAEIASLLRQGSLCVYFCQNLLNDHFRTVVK